MRARGRLGWIAAALVVGVALAPSAAAAQGEAIGWEAPCGDAAGFVAAVVGLGGSFAGVGVEVEVTAVTGGPFRGRLTIRRGEQAPEVRELEDVRCEDVLDALAIAGALALRRSGATVEEPVVEPADTPPAGGEPPMVVPPEPAPPAWVDPATPAREEPARGAVGVGLRGGLGPTPGPGFAPGVVVGLQLRRLWTAFSLSYWPDSAAKLDGEARGVSLWALGSTFEIGYRIGDGVSLVPCAVIEPSLAFARGIGVERPRTETTFVLDAGLAVWLAVDLPFEDEQPRVRLFARGDLLFGIARPVYGVENEAVFSSRVARGTGGAGVLVLF